MIEGMDILSTNRVAALLGVSEATVKRWSDAGTLKCFKTAGGHRKFRLRDVRAFLSDQRDDAPMDVGSVTTLSTEQTEVRSLALNADVDGLVSFVASQRLRGASMAETFDRVFAPALADIGESWARGRLSAAQEHIASGAVGDMLARLRPVVERGSRVDRGRALCACLGEERHELGVRMAAIVLAGEGFRVATAGATVPASDIAMMVAGHAPALLVLSASECADAAGLAADLAIVADAAPPGRTRIVTGGAGFQKLVALPASVECFSSLERLVLALRNGRDEARA
ncbi:MAG: helix-turn-helix domain-containing protein [Myxococcales bacterium]|nr:helix-turn-helix domain-containing protein [Myxococcales bacterium]